VISVESRWASLRQNGQKRSEEIYKDGELISEKWWNSKGEEVETWKETEEQPPHHGAGTRVGGLLHAEPEEGRIRSPVTGCRKSEERKVSRGYLSASARIFSQAM